mmetsp:Transcript_3869/g.5399  ORF Transcript_3869/g.5399 Transcript_3869/m.5399 type:complete len:300 (-) Transcript_3869:3516-4415(-)
MNAHEGIGNKLFEGAVRACEQCAAMNELPERLALEVGIQYEALASIWHQQHALATRRCAHIHRDKASTEYRKAYERGENILQIAERIKFSPVLLARLLLEVILQLPRKSVGDFIKNPQKIPDCVLRQQIEVCIQIDGHYGPRHDQTRHDIGIEYEKRLNQYLDRLAVPFEDEDDLRKRGLAKTPDVLLSIPLGYLFNDNTIRVINWIDSKALFATPHTYHTEHRQQLLGYVNRLGPGAVIYWFGFLDDLQTLDDDILLLSAWPHDGFLFWPDGHPVLLPNGTDAPPQTTTNRQQQTEQR